MRKSFLLKKADFWYFIIFCALFLFLFGDFFFEAKTFYERDTPLLEIPLRMHAAQLLKEGNFALWTEAHGNGQPFLANPKTAIFYPTTWLYLILPFFVAFKIHYLLHPLIGWWGMYLLTQSYGLSKKASFLSSSLFFLSGIYLSSFEFYNHLAAIAWMMWSLYLHRLNPPLKSFRFLLSIFIWVLLILAGAPEFIIITGILAFAQCFMESKNLKQNLIKLSISILMACLISAFQLFPAFEMLNQTSRTSQADIWPLELIQLVNIIFPDFFGDDRQPGHNDFWGGHLFDKWYPLYYSLYLGFGAILLFILSFIYPKKKEEKIFGIAAFIFFLISCGKYSPFFFLYRITPLLSSIRSPVKYIVGTFFCLCLLAGFGLEKLRARQISRGFCQLLFLTSSVCLALFLVFKQFISSCLYKFFVIDNLLSKKLLFISILTGLVALLTYSILLLSINRLQKAKPFLISFLIFICLIDPVYHNRSINPTVSISFLEPPEILKRLGASPVIYRNELVPFSAGIENIEKKRIMAFYWKSLFPYSGITSGVRYVFNLDFMSTYPANQKELMKTIRNLSKEEKLKILKYIGCQYYIGSEPFMSEKAANKIILEGFPLYFEEISAEPPKPYLVFDIIEAASQEEKLEIFLNSDFDPKEKALLDSKLNLKEKFNDQNYFLSLPARDSTGESIMAIEEAAGYGKYVINLQRPGLAIFPGNWAGGWKASLNGQKSKVFSVNLFYKGVFLPAGKHEIIIKYMPNSFVYGSFVSLFTLTCLMAGSFYLYRKRR